MTKILDFLWQIQLALARPWPDIFIFTHYVRIKYVLIDDNTKLILNYMRWFHWNLVIIVLWKMRESIYAMMKKKYGIEKFCALKSLNYKVSISEQLSVLAILMRIKVKKIDLKPHPRKQWFLCSRSPRYLLHCIKLKFCFPIRKKSGVNLRREQRHPIIIMLNVGSSSMTSLYYFHHSVTSIIIIFCRLFPVIVDALFIAWRC